MYALDWAVLTVVVSVVAVRMAPYIVASIYGMAKQAEGKFNGAMWDNYPN